MILQFNELLRALIIFFPQLIMASIFLCIALKLLIRNRHRPTVTLGTFYIIMAAGLVSNAVFLLFTTLQPENEILLLILYFLTSYLLLFSMVFLLTFLISLLKLESKFTLKKQLIIIIVYGLIDLIIILFPGGINFIEELNWRPLYSWPFFICTYVVFTITIVIPTLIFSRHLIRIFKDKILKQKLITFLIGNYGMFLTFYGAILYNTWHDPLFRSIWSVITIILIISSAVFIYYGIGREL